jgi:hypothetical protein
VKLSAEIPLEWRNTFNQALRRNIIRGWQASDHVLVSVPCLGRKHILQAHPFTIMSPALKAHDKEAKLDLLREATERTSLTIRIDGPYGSRHPRALLQDCDIAVLVAGGSGIAVAWPLVNFLLD